MKYNLLKTLLVVASFVLGDAGIIKDMEGISEDDQVSSSTNGIRVSDSLQHIVVMSRHGNRGSSVDYPNDPYPIADVTYWLYGKNQLTNKGRQQEYNLGEKLRTLYNGFLSTTYRTANVNSKSDFVERDIYSGQLVLQGLFPPQGYQVWKSNVSWQPVELFTNSSDHSMFVSSSCERFIADQTEAYAIFEEEDAANISLITQFFYNYTNETYDAEELTYIFEKILSEVTEGYTLPSYLSGIYPQPFADFYVKYFGVEVAGTNYMARLIIGNLYDEILDYIKSKVNGSAPDLKMNYYSGHDASIISLQVALGIPRDLIVPWVKVGSALIIELHKNSTTDEYYVQVIYVDGSNLDSDPISLSLPECGDPCYYEALINSTLEFTNVNYEAECLTTSGLSAKTDDVAEAFDKRFY